MGNDAAKAAGAASDARGGGATSACEQEVESSQAEGFFFLQSGPQFGSQFGPQSAKEEVTALMTLAIKFWEKLLARSRRFVLLHFHFSLAFLWLSSDCQ